MKYKLNPKPKNKQTRGKSRFLIFPVCIEREWRWLEFASWSEVYHEACNMDDYSGWDKRFWLDV